MKEIFRMFFLILISFSFISFYREPTHCRLANKFMNEFSYKVKKEKNLSLIGRGGSMMKNVEEIFFHFVSPVTYDLDNARRFYVETVENFLEEINNNKNIMPYLKNYPFTISNTDIIISFDETSCQFGKGVALIFRTKNGHIFYQTYDLETGKYRELHEEPYEVAREIVKQQMLSH